MLKNYLLVAWRKLIRQRLFSFINIAGLSIGLTCFMLIMLYVMTQYSYDKHHANIKNIYRVETELRSSEGSWQSATVSPPIVPAMRTDFPEVVQATRLVDPPETSHHILKWKDISFYETKGYYVDSTFFDVFDYDWIEGSPGDAINSPYTVVLTKKVKEKLFGTEPAIGQTIQINNRFGNNDFVVSGVVNSSTHRSHIRANFYMSMNSGGIGEYVRNNNQWAGGNFIFGYVKLNAKTDLSRLEAKIPSFLMKYGSEQFKTFGSEKTLTFQPVSDIHVYSDRDNQLDTTSDAGFLRILILIAVFILTIGCVNYMNLATAQSIQNGMNVGIRKTLGASRLHLARQFFTESFFVTGISFVLAAIAGNLLLPFAANFVGEELKWDVLSTQRLIIWMIFLYSFTAFIAGSFPAVFLSSFKPVAAIKAEKLKDGFQDIFRKGLVVFQFSIALCLIIGSLIIIKQLSFMLQKDPGFNKGQKIVIPFRDSEARKSLSTFKSEILSVPGVVNAAGARIYPGQFMPQDFNVYTEGNDMDRSHNVHLIQGDEDYLETLGIPLLAGRNFVRSDTSTQILINQTALRILQLDEEKAVGSTLYSEYENERERYDVIGIIKDYHQNSMKDPIEAIIFTYRPTESNLSLVIDTENNSDVALMDALARKWNELVPSTPFDYQYLDESLKAQYNQENTLAEIISIFTLIAIFISCLGLFGLAAFMVERRTKEISIRKVLGAGIPGLISLLSKDFLKLVLLAILIASPVGAYLMEKWLQHFAYRISIGWSVFVFAGLMTIFLAFMTISFQSVKAALTNPANTLRNE